MSFKFFIRIRTFLIILFSIAGLIALKSLLSEYFKATMENPLPYYLQESKSLASDSKPNIGLYRSSEFLPPRPLLSSEERLSKLKKHCLLRDKRSWSSLSFEEKLITGKYTIVDEGYRILYCFFPKVACANWKRVFSVLYGHSKTAESIKKVDHKNFIFLSDYPPYGIETRLKTYYKFLFVREPLERLVSAYRNKFLVYREYFNERWGSEIVKKFRNPKRRHKNKADNIPTLTEFFRYLIKAKPLKMDGHWMPYKEISQPCVIDYDFIGSFDTLQDDAKRVLRHLQIDDKVQLPRKQSYYDNYSNETSFDHLISQVPRPILRAVVKKYIEDYELFSFPLPKF